MNNSINPIKFTCDCCNIMTNSKKDYEKHMNTKKHYNKTHELQEVPEVSEKSFACKNCNKSYSARNSLWYHEKKCMVSTQPNNQGTDNNACLTMMMDLIKQNNSFSQLIIEQNKKTLDIITEVLMKEPSVL